MDFTNAIECLKLQKETNPNTQYKIGVIKKNIDSLVTYKIGDVVLFEKGIVKNTITVERPMTPEWLQKQKEKGSLLTTVCCIVGVPENYVDEVKGII
jgi:hypothetical protein